jgi:hypothetical protein
MTTNIQEPMMQFVPPLLALRVLLASMWGENNSMLFFQTCSVPFVNEST